MAQKLGNDKAQAKTFIGYACSPNDIKYFEGTIPGRIVSQKGEKGFGWDPIFQVDAANKTFAEMTSDEKNQFSMRGIAAQGLREQLEKEFPEMFRKSVKELTAQFEKIGK